MTTITIPPLPVYPGPDASDADLARFRAELDAFAAAAAAAHAQAQADTAVHMAAASQGQLQMLAALSQALAQPVPPASCKPTRFSVSRGIAEALASRPVPALSSAPSPSSIASTATAIADALIALHPGAVEG